MSQYSILVNSEEFRIFARPELAGGHSDVQSQLSKLTKLAPEDIAKRFYDGFGMNDVMFKASADKQQEYEFSLKEFEIFLKKLMTQYQALKKQIKGLIEIKSGSINSQSNIKRANVNLEQLVDILHKYEEKSLFFYADQSSQKLILGDNTNDLYKSLQEMVRMLSLLTSIRVNDLITHSLTSITGSRVKYWTSQPFKKPYLIEIQLLLNFKKRAKRRFH